MSISPSTEVCLQTEVESGNILTKPCTFCNGVAIYEQHALDRQAKEMQLSVSCSLCFLLPPFSYLAGLVAVFSSFGLSAASFCLHRFLNLFRGVDFHPPLTFVFHLCLVVSLLVPFLFCLRLLAGSEDLGSHPFVLSPQFCHCWSPPCCLALGRGFRLLCVFCPSYLSLSLLSLAYSLYLVVTCRTCLWCLCHMTIM